MVVHRSSRTVLWLLGRVALPNHGGTKVHRSEELRLAPVGARNHQAVRLHGSDPLSSRRPLPKDSQKTTDLAVREGSVELARFLLENGQNPNVAQGSTYQGFWELGACALLGDQPSRAVENLNLMLRYGWVPRPNTYQSGAAHIVAAKIGHMSALRLLVENGADLDLAHNCNDWGGDEWDWYQDVTALSAAAYNEHEDAVAYLLKKGADSLFKDPRGRSCLWAAKQGGTEKVVNMIETTGVTEYR